MRYTSPPPPPVDPQYPYGGPMPAGPPPGKGRSHKGLVAAMLFAVSMVLLLCCVLVFAPAKDDDRGLTETVDTTAPATAAGYTTASPAGEVAPESTEPEPSASTVAPKSVRYDKLAARGWKRLAKDPDAHRGETYIVHGVVTQFDAATGPDSMRADVDGVRHGDRYEYETNTVLRAQAADLDDLVEGDEFTAWVEVSGGLTYETTLGGEVTVPQLAVDKIKRR